jgi:hypothetical protein
VAARTRWQANGKVRTTIAIRQITSSALRRNHEIANASFVPRRHCARPLACFDSGNALRGAANRTYC